MKSLAQGHTAGSGRAGFSLGNLYPLLQNGHWLLHWERGPSLSCGPWLGQASFPSPLPVSSRPWSRWAAASGAYPDICQHWLCEGFN